MNKGTYYFPRNRTYQPETTSGGGGAASSFGPFTFKTYIDIDMSLGDYYITESAYYYVKINDLAYSVIFPDPTPLDGQIIYVWYDPDGIDDLQFSGTYAPYQPTAGSSQISSLKHGYGIKCFSIHNKWYYREFGY